MAGWKESNGEGEGLAVREGIQTHGDSLLHWQGLEEGRQVGEVWILQEEGASYFRAVETGIAVVEGSMIGGLEYCGVCMSARIVHVCMCTYSVFVCVCVTVDVERLLKQVFPSQSCDLYNQTVKQDCADEFPYSIHKG